MYNFLLGLTGKQMKCVNCTKLAACSYQEVPLCLDCYIRLRDLNIREIEMIERESNFIIDQIEGVCGVYGALPRYPERRTVIQSGGVTLNNIHVTNSEIGVLNTGAVQTIDSTLTVLKSEGNSALAVALQKLSEAVIRASDLTNNQKNESLELLGAMSEEAVAPAPKRKLAVVKAMLAQMASTLAGVASVASAFEDAKAAISALL